MNHLLVLSLALQATLDMHQAAGIADNQGRGGGLLQVRDLAFQELCRKFGMFQREDTAETAAIRAFRQFNDLSLFDA